jgi:hypothetical protein
LKNFPSKLPAWHKATSESVVDYRNLVEDNLRELSHMDLKEENGINSFAKELSSALLFCAKLSIPFSSYNPHTRPEWTKSVKHLHTIERSKQRVWISEGRPCGLQFPSNRDYKQAKRDFPNALDKEHDNYMRKVYSDTDKAAEVNARLFWKQTKRRKPKTWRVCPEICDENRVTHTDPHGVAEAFASFFEKLYAPLD